MPDWKIYRTRFLVKARKLAEPMVVFNQIGKSQTGQPGDYLVECSDGTQRICPAHVFEDVYVEMSSAANGTPPARLSRMPVQPGNPAG